MASDKDGLGKIGNCQIGVSLTVATKHEHAVRREKARVPDDLVFKTKPDLALDLITRAVEDKIPGDIRLPRVPHAVQSKPRHEQPWLVMIYGTRANRPRCQP